MIRSPPPPFFVFSPIEAQQLCSKLRKPTRGYQAKHNQKIAFNPSSRDSQITSNTLIIHSFSINLSPAWILFPCCSLLLSSHHVYQLTVYSGRVRPELPNKLAPVSVPVGREAALHDRLRVTRWPYAASYWAIFSWQRVKRCPQRCVFVQNRTNPTERAHVLSTGICR